jgi:hypothetical protein
MLRLDRHQFREQQVWRVLVVEDDPQMRGFFASSVERCSSLSSIRLCSL